MLTLILLDFSISTRLQQLILHGGLIPIRLGIKPNLTHDSSQAQHHSTSYTEDPTLPTNQHTCPENFWEQRTQTCSVIDRPTHFVSHPLGLVPLRRPPNDVMHAHYNRRFLLHSLVRLNPYCSKDQCSHTRSGIYSPLLWIACYSFLHTLGSSSWVVWVWTW